VLPDNIAKINGGPMKKGKVSGSPKKGRAAPAVSQAVPAPAVPQPAEDDSAAAASNDALQESAGTTLTKSVYEQVRSDLLTGRLKPGEKLRAEALRHRFKVGSSPIREALNRLLSEGFVSLEEQKGFRVALLSVQELRELLDARIWIDGAAVRASIERFDTEWEEGLVLALHRLSRIERSASSAENEQWNRLHRNFHLALVSGSGSRWMTKTSALLFDAAERYRLYVAGYVSGPKKLDEHRQMVAACIERKPDLALQLMRQHYGETCDVISKYMNSETDQIEQKA
jgi:GntR family carbon starvation induced transcriptional regulator